MELVMESAMKIWVLDGILFNPIVPMEVVELQLVEQKFIIGHYGERTLHSTYWVCSGQ